MIKHLLNYCILYSCHLIKIQFIWVAKHIFLCICTFIFWKKLKIKISYSILRFRFTMFNIVFLSLIFWTLPYLPSSGSVYKHWHRGKCRIQTSEQLAGAEPTIYHFIKMLKLDKVLHLNLVLLIFTHWTPVSSATAASSIPGRKGTYIKRHKCKSRRVSCNDLLALVSYT